MKSKSRACGPTRPPTSVRRSACAPDVCESACVRVPHRWRLPRLESETQNLNWKLETRNCFMSRYVSFRDFDWVLLVFVLAICGLGVMEIYSATLGTKFAGVHLKQVYWIMGGLGVMFLVSLINYQALLERVPWMY